MCLLVLMCLLGYVFLDLSFWFGLTCLFVLLFHLFYVLLLFQLFSFFFFFLCVRFSVLDILNDECWGYLFVSLFVRLFVCVADMAQLAEQLTDFLSLIAQR